MIFCSVPKIITPSSIDRKEFVLDKVIVIGGGPAGMMAAITAKKIKMMF